MSKKLIDKDAERAAMKRFSKVVDREALEMFLAEKDNPKYETFLALLHDPAYAKLPFAQIARLAKISLSEFQQVYTDGMRHMGLLRMANALPQIMEDVAEDARNSTQLCHRCDGTGIVPDGERKTKVCPVCDGERRVKKMGDKHARNLIFETAKLTGQAGPMVAIQQNFSIGDTRMESMLKKTRSIVLEPPKKIDSGE